MSEVRALSNIVTYYKDHKFRSRLEARWSVVFDSLDIEYVYEPQGFVLLDGTTYLPDFYLPNTDCFFEVKGVMSDIDFKKVSLLSRQTNKTVVIGLSDMTFYMISNENNDDSINADHIKNVLIHKDYSLKKTLLLTTTEVDVFYLLLEYFQLSYRNNIKNYNGRFVYTGRETMADKIGKSVATVNRAVRTLVSKGLIETKKGIRNSRTYLTPLSKQYILEHSNKHSKFNNTSSIICNKRSETHIVFCEKCNAYGFGRSIIRHNSKCCSGITEYVADGNFPDHNNRDFTYEKCIGNISIERVKKAFIKAKRIQFEFSKV